MFGVGVAQGLMPSATNRLKYICKIYAKELEIVYHKKNLMRKPKAGHPEKMTDNEKD